MTKISRSTVYANIINVVLLLELFDAILTIISHHLTSIANSWHGEYWQLTTCANSVLQIRMEKYTNERCSCSAVCVHNNNNLYYYDNRRMHKITVITIPVWYNCIIMTSKKIYKLLFSQNIIIVDKPSYNSCVILKVLKFKRSVDSWLTRASWPRPLVPCRTSWKTQIAAITKTLITPIGKGSRQYFSYKWLVILRDGYKFIDEF